MAGLAGSRPFFAMIEGKNMLWEEGGNPGCGGMALLAFEAEKTRVDFWLGVAAAAGSWCVFKLMTSVAGGAFQVRMAPL